MDSGAEPLGPASPKMSDRAFADLSEVVRRICGIHLASHKRVLLESRLARRLRALSLPNFEAYIQHLRGLSANADEWSQLTNAITTNKTEFFREPHHFKVLVDDVLRQALTRPGPRTLQVWSAGCSTGEEPYTIVMALHEAGAFASGVEVKIYATDIDTDVLRRAREGVYHEERMKGLSREQLHRHFLRGKGKSEGLWKVKAHLQQAIEFRKVNLTAPPWHIPDGFDVIFCRNVMIYFDKVTQKRLVEGFADHLKPGGTLFVGHSESLQDLTSRFVSMRNTAYRLAGDAGNPVVRAKPVLSEQVHRIVVGDVFTSPHPSTVSTLLGSCVAACLFDPVAKVGGMNHFLVPDAGDDGPNALRYGVHAMERLINDLLNLGANKRRLKAKVFGASEILKIASGVPQKNANFVFAFLKKEGIPVVGQRLGGERPMQVMFKTDSGQAFVRVRPEAVKQVMRQEAQAVSRFEESIAPKGGEIELF